MGKPPCDLWYKDGGRDYGETYFAIVSNLESAVRRLVGIVLIRHGWIVIALYTLSVTPEFAKQCEKERERNNRTSGFLVLIIWHI
jgi:hypothetical protein